jgi:ribonuclease P protein subunit POP4
MNTMNYNNNTIPLTTQEFIGSDAIIIRSSNSQVVGLNGTIIDETRSMFFIKTAKGLKKIPKRHSVWNFNHNNHNHNTQAIIDGNTLQKRSWDRVAI